MGDGEWEKQKRGKGGTSGKNETEEEVGKTRTKRRKGGNDGCTKLFLTCKRCTGNKSSFILMYFNTFSLNVTSNDLHMIKILNSSIPGKKKQDEIFFWWCYQWFGP